MNQPAFQQEGTWSENKEALNSQEEILQALKLFGAEEGTGKFLKQLRELAERPEASFAAELGISLHQLQAMESDDFDNLPAPIYMKSYYQRYCALIGVSDGEFLRTYEQMRQSQSPQLNRVSIKEKVNGTQVSLGWLKYVGIAAIIAIILFWVQSQDIKGLWSKATGTAEVSEQATELTIPERKVEEVAPQEP